jgi:hypothetical protein
MKKLLFVIMVLCLFTVTASADNFFGLFKRGVKGSGDISTETRDVKDFNRIKSTGSFDIYVEVGKDYSLEITFDDNLIDLVSTEVRGKTLYLDTEESFRSRRSCKINITVPDLELVKLSGSGDIEVVNLDCEKFEYTISGSGDLIASGKVDELEVRVSGSGDIDTRELIAKVVYASVSGSGDIKLYAEETFEGRISGSGDIDYYGDPENVSTSVSGSGDISKR